MKILMLVIATLQCSVGFEKLKEHIKKIHEHKDEELHKYKGNEYMIQVINPVNFTRIIYIVH